MNLGWGTLYRHDSFHMLWPDLFPIKSFLMLCLLSNQGFNTDHKLQILQCWCWSYQGLVCPGMAQCFNSDLHNCVLEPLLVAIGSHGPKRTVSRMTARGQRKMPLYEKKSPSAWNQYTQCAGRRGWNLAAVVASLSIAYKNWVTVHLTGQSYTGILCNS